MAIVENSKTKLTYEDYVGFPEDGRRHEIIDGDHYVTPSPSSYHQLLSVSITAQLFTQVRSSGMGQVLPAPIDVFLSQVDIVQPDIIVILEEHTSIITKKNIQGPPDLVVEILSPTTSDRDRNLKKSLYQRAGVREYWIVDPDAKHVEQYVLEDNGQYAARGRHDDEITAQALPGVKVDLAKVW